MQICLIYKRVNHIRTHNSHRSIEDGHRHGCH